MNESMIQKLIQSRNAFQRPLTPKSECEGGCGVVGLACAEKIAGRHLLPALCQMKNRGNGKGGGIAAAGLSPDFFGISQETLESHYLIAVAYLDNICRAELEREFLHSIFHVNHVHEMPSAPSLPRVILYFCRVKEVVSKQFQKQHGLDSHEIERIEDEIVYQNSFSLNEKFYLHFKEKKAFVLSHAKNLLVLKVVGYADDVITGYGIEQLQAHVWIGHHRYPTKGKVWHPGGAHPFIGLHEALVHNGDFANYFSLCEYLSQRGIYPQFSTDTEAAALLFDLLHRTYRYPLEYVFEALAPTTEHDFFRLSQEKQWIYDQIQKTHLHASPDGPWFFIIAHSLGKQFRLIGITDTSMLRPQVFAMQSGEAPIGIIASEKQAIDAVLRSLAEEDGRFWPRADHYWSCRGGSYTDGGAFTFTVTPQEKRKTLFTCANKFGNPFAAPMPTEPARWKKKEIQQLAHFPDLPPLGLLRWVKEEVVEWDEEQAITFLNALQGSATNVGNTERAFATLTLLMDRLYPKKKMRRSFWQALLNASIEELIEKLHGNEYGGRIFLDARHYPTEGKDSLARAIVNSYLQGYKRIVVGCCRGHRFIGNGLGPLSHGVEIDVYGSSGDYLASGIDGAQITAHGNNIQDQAAQIMKDGKFIVHGGAGQTLLYGAKGGTTFVRGGAAGRPMINAVGKAKLIINGTALDYCAESFMAGDPLAGGGFVLINRIYFDNEAVMRDLSPPYPGGNLFSLASGGAIYIRDPRDEVREDQLNGGMFTSMTKQDEDLIIPYLQENERIFDIPLQRLLTKNDHHCSFQEAYRKIIPRPTHLVDPEAAWVKKR